MANKDLQNEINKLIDLQKKYFSIQYDNNKYYEKEQTILEMKLQNNNCISVFIDQYYNSIIDTLRKYKDKRIGEKTKEKIANEIKELSSDIAFVHFYNGYNSWDSKDYTLSIELKNETYTHSRVKINIKFWNYEKLNSPYNIETNYSIDINGCNKENYIYIDNTREQAEKILSSYNELKAFKEEKLKEINDRIDEHFKKYNLITLDNYDYYTIKKTYN